MFHVQIQEPAGWSTTIRASVFLAKFAIAKYLKQEVDHYLSVCVDECKVNVNFKCKVMLTEAYLEPRRKPTMELFWENS